MPVTVKQIMELEEFSQVANLVAGEAGIHNIITFVTIAEAPDFYQWVSGGEFVLSTLYAFKDSPQLMGSAYTELAKSGIAAIGIKTRRFVDEIPAELVAIANEYKVPLFEIERETKFRQVIQAITAEINNEQTNLLVEVERHYKELAEAALVSDDFDLLLRGFGRRRKCPVLFLAADLKTLGSYPNVWRDTEVEAVKRKLLSFHQKQEDLLLHEKFDAYHFFPCVTRGQAIGYLVLQDDKELNEKFELMAKQLTTFLTLKLIDRIDSEQKTLTALLDDMLFKHNLSEDDLRERLSLHGLKQEGGFRVIVVRHNSRSFDLGQSSAFRASCEKIRRIIGNGLLIHKADEAVLIASGQQLKTGAVPLSIRLIQEEIVAATMKIIVGVGPSVAFARDIHSSYAIAKSTLKVGRIFNPSGVHYYSEYLSRILLLKAKDTSEHKYIRAAVIEPVRLQDERYHSQLLETLGALIFADDLDSAAANLFVHVNTIRYRIGKIKQLTGYDFFSAKGRYTLTTAYLMYCYEL